MTVAVISSYRQYSLQISSVAAVPQNPGSCVERKLEENGADARIEILRRLIVFKVILVAGVISLIAGLNSSNKATAKTPM